jgi:hypothetical protein
MDSVYELENRGFEYFYHWIFCILSGLRFLEKDDKKTDIYMPWLKEHGFHYEALSYFEDKFNFFTTKDKIEGREVKFFHGEPLLAADRIADEGYTYIRNKMLSKVNYKMIPKKYVYISRKNSEKLVSNVKKIRPVHHSIINEEELINMLSSFDFEIIHLENLNFNEKIRLFCEAEIIVAPYGGSLVPSIVSSTPQKIVELVNICVHNTGWRHYKIICEKTGANHYTYCDINYSDAEFNIHLKLDKLFIFLKELTE